MCEEDEDKRSLSERWADAVFERDNFELTSMVQDPTAPVSAVVIQLNEKNVICGDDAGGRTALEAALYWNDGVLFKALIRHINFDVAAVIRRAVLLYQFGILRRMIKAGGLSTEGRRQIRSALISYPGGGGLLTGDRRNRNPER